MERFVMWNAELLRLGVRGELHKSWTARHKLHILNREELACLAELLGWKQLQWRIVGTNFARVWYL